MADYLITGVSRGIGRAVAERLLAGGHRVYGIARSPVTEPALTGQIALDLAEPAGFAEALAPLLATVTRLDGLVHCAGVVRPGPMAEAGPDVFLEQFTVNVVAVAQLTRIWLPALRAVAGTVLLVNSGSGLNARPPLSTYGVSKFALRGYAEALRQEEPGIRVSAVYPGRTDTDMQRTVREAESGSYQPADYLRPETVAEVIVSVLLLPADGAIPELVLRPAAHPGPSSPDARR
ncbi:MAG TPA: SDR family oxidoreductase [Jatrophihabitans sp.]|nr:SDR family oxidoreductase [Jatrophihabitans sp.]